MANKVIRVTQVGTSQIEYDIVDVAATIDTLWTTSQTLVNRFADFTSVIPHFYAKKAVRYDTSLVFDSHGNFISGHVQTTFDAGLNRPPTQIGPYQPTDGTATVTTLAKAVDDLQNVVINAGIADRAAA